MCTIVHNTDVSAARTVHHGDGLAFLATTPLPADHAIITSLPDVSELPELGGLAAWRAWFISTVSLICRTVADDAVAIFFQTDIKHAGRWIDKGHLVLSGADAASSHALFHKIVCRVPPATTTFGRPAYAHLLGFSKGVRPDPGKSTADVIPRLGAMPWSRAMGVEACKVACAFLRDDVATRVVVDPFCGKGTVLAVANAMGMDSIGVELSAKRCRAARSMALDAL